MHEALRSIWILSSQKDHVVSAAKEIISTDQKFSLRDNKYRNRHLI